MNWTDSTTASIILNTDYNGTVDTSGYITFTSPDPLIDWLPPSCLYTKYVPTWHLVRSYR